MAKWMGTTISVAMSTVTARSTVLTNGKYEVYATVDWFMQQGGSAVTAATASSRWLQAGSATVVDVGDVSEGYIAGILAAGTGTMYITPITGPL